MADTSLARTEPVGVTPMRLIELASERGASIEQLAQLFELKLRVEADEAAKGYNAAMAQFKRNPPRITKNKDVSFGTTAYSHATLDHAADAIIPALSAVGISHKWVTEQRDGKIIVSCVLTHILGHSEKTTLESGADTSGSKNPIQAIASAVTYLERYTLLAAVGLAVGGTDDDGVTAGPVPTMGDEEFIALRDNIDAAENLSELKKFYEAAYKRAQEIGDRAAMESFISAKDARKKAIA